MLRFFSLEDVNCKRLSERIESTLNSYMISGKYDYITVRSIIWAPYASSLSPTSGRYVAFLQASQKTEGE